MDERLLEHYNTELRHLREMAGEFAREFPKIAGRLSLDKDAKEICPDPYVERLLEGFAWLAARIHLKLDAEFPRFTQALLETVYPLYLCPIPSMAVVRFEPDEQEAALAAGMPIPRGTLLKSLLGKEDKTSCTFQTAHEVRLLSVKIKEVRYFTRDTVELNLPSRLGARAAIRIRLQATGGTSFDQIKLDPITFFLRGADEFPTLIYEQIFAHKNALIVQSAAERGKTHGIFSAKNVQRVGFSNKQALLPSNPRTFEGYRLLREYFAFYQRFLFFELTGFAEALKQCGEKENELDLVIALKEQEPRLEGRLNASAFDLFCTPAVNLFSKTLDRINLSDRFSEFQAIADRNRPLDFEVYELQSVTGYGALPGEEQEFRPFYLAKDTDVTSGAFYTTSRVPRLLTERDKKFGRRSSYAGTEVFLSLVDASAAPYRPDLRQLGIKALCTNRHLPIQMAVGIGRTDFTLEISAPVKSVRCLSGPTLPRPSLAEGRFAWRLISHLSLNYLSLIDTNPEEGAVALREILKLYSDPNDRQIGRQIDGLRHIRARPINRRVATPGPITFARGIEITVTFDETAFEGTGVFVLGGVLEQFFAKYVSLNSFTETVVKTQQRGEIMRWPAQIGRSQIL
jgi:type VI secretion system protein ImpG